MKLGPAELYCGIMGILVFVFAILFLTLRDENGNVYWWYLILSLVCGVLVFGCKDLIPGGF